MGVVYPGEQVPEGFIGLAANGERFGSLSRCVGGEGGKRAEGPQRFLRSFVAISNRVLGCDPDCAVLARGG